MAPPRLRLLRPGDTLTAPLRAFLKVDAASGLVLLAAACVALALANSPFAAAWADVWKVSVGTQVGAFDLDRPLYWWVNDLLMAVFFLVVGLEIKRELVRGELSDPRNMALPVAAAVGGAVLPAAMFLGATWGSPAADGWAVPMATDIAFVVGALALLGDRIPRGLKVVLLSLAIVDDLIAVGVIALFYTGSLDLGWLAVAAVGISVHATMVTIGVRQLWPYLLVGLGVWLATLGTGLHPTVAGVALGLATPMDADREGCFAEHLEHLLHPWSAFAIMPIFALANAGVSLSLEALVAPAAVATSVALAVGKPGGILLASWFVVRAGVGVLPRGVTWLGMAGGGALCGIGFTMSLFIAGLAYDPASLDAARAGILVGSLVAGLGGLALLGVATRSEVQADVNTEREAA